MKFILIIIISLLSISAMAQTDSTEIKLINKYNETVTQIEELTQQKGLLEGYLLQKSEFLKQYEGLIDEKTLENNPELKNRVEEYKKAEDNYKKIVELIPQLKGKLQAIAEEINSLKNKNKLD